MKSKKVGGILAKPAPKTGKTITSETLHLVTSVYEDDNFSRQMPRKKDYVSVSKRVHKQKLCNLKKLYAAFKEKHSNVNIVGLSLKNTRVVGARQNSVLLL